MRKADNNKILRQYQSGILITVFGNIAAAIVFFLFSFLVPIEYRFWLRIASIIMVFAGIAMLLFWSFMRKKFEVKQ